MLWRRMCRVHDHACVARVCWRRLRLQVALAECDVRPVSQQRSYRVWSNQFPRARYDGGMPIDEKLARQALDKIRQQDAKLQEKDAEIARLRKRLGIAEDLGDAIQKKLERPS